MLVLEFSFYGWFLIFLTGFLALVGCAGGWLLTHPRHCERSEAIHLLRLLRERWIASLRSQ